MEFTVKKKLSKAERDLLLEVLQEEHQLKASEIVIHEPKNAILAELGVEVVKSGDTSKADANVAHVYSERFVVMQNVLINAISHLELHERRLIMFLSPIVRKEVDKNANARTFTVSALDFAEAYDMSPSNAYVILRKVARSLLFKAFFYWNNKDNIKNEKGVSWIGECDYISGKGKLEITLTDTVIEMLTLFDKLHPYTKIERDHITNLGSYSLVLFELICSCLHLKNHKKRYSVEHLREKLDCVDKYESVTDFKNSVLVKAIKEIEAHTPIRAKLETYKDGRNIAGFVLTVKDTSKKKAIRKKRESLYMSEKQALKYAIALKKEPAIVGNWSGSYDDAERRIMKELQDPATFEKYLRFLRKDESFKENSLKSASK